MSIDRIGSFANTQFMLAQIQKAENAVDTSNRQVSTGKLSDTYTGYGDKTAVMEAARPAAGRADANTAAAKQAAMRLDVQDAQLTQFSDLAGQIRQALTKAAADQDAGSLMYQLEGYFNQVVDLLNSKDANGYVYAGDNSQVPPVTVSSLADLAALPTVADAFANGTVKTTVRVGENQTVQVGILASDVATDLFTLLRQVAQFDGGVNGPFGGTTTPAQQSFVESQILGSIDVQNGVNGQAAANGIRYKAVQSSIEQLQASSTIYKSFVSNIEDVDMTQAITQLNQNQIALQAAFQVASTLNRLSLLDYMPII